jgi:hypothetical protein
MQLRIGNRWSDLVLLPRYGDAASTNVRVRRPLSLNVLRASRSTLRKSGVLTPHNGCISLSPFASQPSPPVGSCLWSYPKRSDFHPHLGTQIAMRGWNCGEKAALRCIFANLVVEGIAENEQINHVDCVESLQFSVIVAECTVVAAFSRHQTSRPQ